MRDRDLRGVGGGLFLVAVGLLFILGGAHLPVGTPQRMGPGAFPVALALILIALGLVIAARSVPQGAGEHGKVAWRALFAILAGIGLFGLAIERIGFVPAAFLAIVVAAYASHRTRFAAAAALGIAGSFCMWFVFSFGLGLPAPAFRVPF